MIDFIVYCFVSGFGFALFFYFTGYGVSLIESFSRWR
jgi:hypothetical protein